MPATERRGLVLSIHRSSLHDGPGLRTTVFLKGCHLRCAWCHNPESWSPRPELRLRDGACIGCRDCAAACPNHRFGTCHAIDRPACAACGGCAAACPSGALEILGAWRTAEEVADDVLADRAWFAGQGGVTLSGGEPLDQWRFAAGLLARLAMDGVHTAIETSGHAPSEAVEAVLPYVALWLLDWKASNEEEHRRHTGVGNAPVRRTLARLEASGARVCLRCPLVPGINDGDEHLAGIAALARGHSCIEAVELMPYHRLGASKAIGVGHEATLDLPSAGPDDVAAWRGRLAAYGCVPV